MKKLRKKWMLVIMCIVLAMSSAVPAAASTTTKSSVSKLKKISLNKSSIKMKVGKTKTLKVSFKPAKSAKKKNVKWTSSNKSVATVKNGTITAKKTGTTKITAKIGSKKATCKVTVTQSSTDYMDTTECYTILNQYRSAAGVSSLKRDAKLESCAQTRAKEIVTKFSHVRPNGTLYSSLLSASVSAETLAYGQKTYAAAISAWNSSPQHRKSMLGKNYKKVGIAGYKYNGTVYWVQIFTN